MVTTDIKQDNRIHSIDITRGLVMVIMAIDHIRDLMHAGALTQDPLDFSTTNPTLFLTRWITHLCAPTFVFLSGCSAYLAYKKKDNLKYSRKFLLTRGIWLIILEFSIITFAVWWDVHFRFFLLQVIAAIGFGFIILSFLLKVKPRYLLFLGILIVVGHDFLLTFFSPTSPVFLNILFNRGVTPLPTGKTMIIAYPLIPWLGIMLCGFGAGPLFKMPQPVRKKYFLYLGISAIALFLLLRVPNFYGDIAPWSSQKTATFTFLSLMNISKYPPSLLYTLIILGIMFIILFLTEGANNFFTRILEVYGKVPMFYYLCHWYILHITMFAIIYGEGFHTKDLFPSPTSFGRPTQPNGVSLPYIYLIWFCIVLSLYPLCKWYGKYRSNHPEKTWLNYF